MARAGREAARSRALQEPANAVFRVADTPAILDQLLQINAAPAHHAIALRFRTGIDQRRQFCLLRRAQLGFRTRRLAIDQPSRTRGIEAVHPLAQRLPIQRLPIQRPGTRRLAAPLAFLDRRDRKQPAHLVPLCRFAPRRSHPSGSPLRTQHNRRHRTLPAKTGSPSIINRDFRKSLPAGHSQRGLVLVASG
jgi:hypothetical protein